MIIKIVMIFNDIYFAKHELVSKQIFRKYIFILSFLFPWLVFFFLNFHDFFIFINYIYFFYFTKLMSFCLTSIFVNYLDLDLNHFMFTKEMF